MVEQAGIDEKKTARQEMSEALDRITELVADQKSDEGMTEEVATRISSMLVVVFVAKWLVETSGELALTEASRSAERDVDVFITMRRARHVG